MQLATDRLSTMAWGLGNLASATDKNPAIAPSLAAKNLAAACLGFDAPNQRIRWGRGPLKPQPIHHPDAKRLHHIIAP